jgi:hypothetical protein
MADRVYLRHPHRRRRPPVPLGRRHPVPAPRPHPARPAPAGAGGAAVGIDLAADDPGTKMMVNVPASVLEFQRDMISENTRQVVTAYSQGPGPRASRRTQDHPPRPGRRRSPPTARPTGHAPRSPGAARPCRGHARDARPARPARRPPAGRRRRHHPRRAHLGADHPPWQGLLSIRLTVPLELHHAALQQVQF